MPAPPQESRPHALVTWLWQRFVLSLAQIASAPLRVLPRRAALRFGTMLGSGVGCLARKARRRAQSNLRLAYRDELTETQRRRLVRDVFRHFGRFVVDFIRAPLHNRAFLASHVSSQGWEHVEAARSAGRGVLLCTAHLGNWEVLGRWLALHHGIAFTTVAREQRNLALSAYLRAVREGGGFSVLSKGTSASGLLRSLKRGDFVLLLPDQNSGDVFAPFFGVPAGTVNGPASLALHTGAPLVPIFCLQHPQSGDFEVICLPPIDTSASGDKRADTVRIAGEMNAVLESVIRCYPNQWLWLHNRWKSAFEEKNHERAWDEAEDSSAARESRKVSAC